MITILNPPPGWSQRGFPENPLESMPRLDFLKGWILGDEFGLPKWGSCYNQFGGHSMIYDLDISRFTASAAGCFLRPIPSFRCGSVLLRPIWRKTTGWSTKHSVLGSHAAHAYFTKPSSRWWGLNGTHFHQLQRTQSEISHLTTSNKSHLVLEAAPCTAKISNIRVGSRIRQTMEQVRISRSRPGTEVKGYLCGLAQVHEILVIGPLHLWRWIGNQSEVEKNPLSVYI